MRTLVRPRVAVAITLAAVVALFAVPAWAAANAIPGSVRQVAGQDGCYTADGSSAAGAGTCRKITGGNGSTSIVISPDGRSAYLIGYGKSAQAAVPPVLSVFRRDPRTGVLHQLTGKAGCFSRNGSSNAGPHTCTVARDLDSGDAQSLAISADGRFLYAASQYRTSLNTAIGGIAIFSRNTKTGALRQLMGKEGCITDNGTTAESGATVVCRAMPNLGAPWDVATPDNHFVYVPDKQDNLVQAFRRDSKGGLVALTGKGACVSDTGGSPLGPNTCVHGRGLFDVERAVLSANKEFIYTNGYSFPSPIAVLNRNLRTGALSQRSGTAACISDDGTSGDTTATCRDGRALAGGYAGALAPNGTTLYYAEYSANGIVIFHVSVRTGSFTQLSGKHGCVTASGGSEDGAGTCQRARAVENAYQIAIASGGRDIYVAAYGGNGTAFFHAVG